MSAAHTPGPWAWFGNRSGGVYLATTHSGRKYVMGFRRYGMNGAQPVFRCNDRMVPASELVEFEVGDGSVRGFKEADKDGSVYRYDVSAIDNPDARLIAAAPALLEALETEARAAELSAAIMRNQKRTGAWSGAEKTAQAFDRIAKNLRAAIALAKGESA